MFGLVVSVMHHHFRLSDDVMATRNITLDSTFWTSNHVQWNVFLSKKQSYLQNKFIFLLFHKTASGHPLRQSHGAHEKLKLGKSRAKREERSHFTVMQKNNKTLLHQPYVMLKLIIFRLLYNKKTSTS